jgi:hypothetical protein
MTHDEFDMIKQFHGQEVRKDLKDRDFDKDMSMKSGDNLRMTVDLLKYGNIDFPINVIWTKFR